MDSKIDWNDVIKKEARGNSNLDLGEIQQVLENSIIVQKGLIDKEIYQFPKSLVRKFDGKVLTIEVTESQLLDFKIDDSQPATMREQYLSTSEIDGGGGSGGGIQIEQNTTDESHNSSNSP
jgi:hypothetical protein